jgi:hypothetical protein
MDLKRRDLADQRRRSPLRESTYADALGEALSVHDDYQVRETGWNVAR